MGLKWILLIPFPLFTALASIIKCILVMHYKEIPGNLNYGTPNPEIKGIAEGKLKVVDKTTPLRSESNLIFKPRCYGQPLMSSDF